MTATDPTPAPGISEERLAEIEARDAAMNASGKRDDFAHADRHVLLAEVRRLRQQVERVDALLDHLAAHPNSSGLALIADVRAALGSSHG